MNTGHGSHVGRRWLRLFQAKALGVVVLLAVVQTSGCAAMRAARARSDYLLPALEATTLPGEPTAVLAQAARLLVERGAQVRQVANLTLETEPASSGDATTHYVVAITPVEGGCRLVAVRHSARWEQGYPDRKLVNSSARDPELELAIVRRVAPKRGEALEREAQRRALLAAEPDQQPPRESPSSDESPPKSPQVAAKPPAEPEEPDWLDRRTGLFGGPFVGAGLMQELGGTFGYSFGRAALAVSGALQWHTFEHWYRWWFAGGQVVLRVHVLPVWTVGLAGRLTFPLQPAAGYTYPVPSPDVAAGVDVVPVQLNLGPARRHELSLVVPIILHQQPVVPVPVMIRYAFRIGH